MKNLCQYNSNTLRPYQLAMIEVAVLSLSNPVFMASEISMTCIKMNVYGTDVLLVWQYLYLPTNSPESVPQVGCSEMSNRLTEHHPCWRIGDCLLQHSCNRTALDRKRTGRIMGNKWWSGQWPLLLTNFISCTRKILASLPSSHHLLVSLNARKRLSYGGSGNETNRLCARRR